MDKAKVYIKENKERFISELLDLLRIPSISAQSERKPDMQRCAEFLAAALVKAGADRADVLPTEGNPVVYAEKTVDPGAKTVLVYGHYDVMPVDRATSGARNLSSRSSATAASGAAAPTTTRASCGCTPRRSRRCAPPIRCPAT